MAGVVNTCGWCGRDVYDMMQCQCGAQPPYSKPENTGRLVRIDHQQLHTTTQEFFPCTIYAVAVVYSNVRAPGSITTLVYQERVAGLLPVGANELIGRARDYVEQVWDEARFGRLTDNRFVQGVVGSLTYRRSE